MAFFNCPSPKLNTLDASENVRLVDTSQFASVVVLDLMVQHSQSFNSWTANR